MNVQEERASQTRAEGPNLISYNTVISALGHSGGSGFARRYK